MNINEESSILMSLYSVVSPLGENPGAYNQGGLLPRGLITKGAYNQGGL